MRKTVLSAVEANRRLEEVGADSTVGEGESNVPISTMEGRNLWSSSIAAFFKKHALSRNSKAGSPGPPIKQKSFHYRRAKPRRKGGGLSEGPGSAKWLLLETSTKGLSWWSPPLKSRGTVMLSLQKETLLHDARGFETWRHRRPMKEK